NFNSTGAYNECSGAESAEEWVFLIKQVGIGFAGNTYAGIEKLRHGDSVNIECLNKECENPAGPKMSMPWSTIHHRIHSVVPYVMKTYGCRFTPVWPLHESVYCI